MKKWRIFLNLFVGVVIGVTGTLIFTFNSNPKEFDYNNLPNEMIMELEFYRYNHDKFVGCILGESE